MVQCETHYSNYHGENGVCSVNGQNIIMSHASTFEFECEQRNDPSIKLKHKGDCWEWELRYGIETYQVLLVSELLIIFHEELFDFVSMFRYWFYSFYLFLLDAGVYVEPSKQCAKRTNRIRMLCQHELQGKLRKLFMITVKIKQTITSMFILFISFIIETTSFLYYYTNLLFIHWIQ